jgi:hypothetical protein
MQPAQFDTEDDMFTHFLDVHCFDGISGYSDEKLRQMNFDVCEHCHIVFKNGMVHKKTECRKPRRRPNTLAGVIPDRSRLFREQFLKFDFATLHPNVDTLSIPELFRSRAATLDYMPGNEALQNEFRIIFIALVKSLMKANHQSDAPIWQLLMSLPRLLFLVPVTKDKDKQSTASIVSQRIGRFFNGQFRELVDECRDTTNRLKKSSRRTMTNIDATAHQATTILKTTGDISRASRRLHSKSTIADLQTPGVLESIADLLGANHRGQEQLQPCETFRNDCPTFEKETVREALSKSNKSASGITGWHITFLRTIAQTKDGLVALTYFLNRIFTMDMPVEIRRNLNIGVLVPLTKEKGGYRPIIIGDALIRLIGKCVVTLEQRQLASHLEPLQTAVNVKSGAEVVIHGIRAHLESNKDHMAIGIDFKNAFGSIKRNCVAQALNSFDYEQSKFSRWFYNHYGFDDSRVLTESTDQGEERIITYDSGVPQGGPLSMFWYCVGSHKLLVAINDFLFTRGGYVISYADDTFVVGKPKDVFEAFELVLREGPQYGLIPRPDKCKILVTQDDLFDRVAEHCADAQLPAPSRAIEILGTPVGTPDAERRLADDLDIEASFNALSTIKDYQCYLIFLRYCIATQHQYITRTLPPDSSCNISGRVDFCVKQAVTQLLGEDYLQPEVWQEACLPLSLGGLGLKRLKEHSSPDYFASASTALLHWRNVLGADHFMFKDFHRERTRSAKVLVAALVDCQNAVDKFFNSEIKPTAADPAEPEKDLPVIKTVKLPDTLEKLFTSTTPNENKLQSQLYQIYSRNSFREKWRSLSRISSHRIQMLAKTTGSPQYALQAMPTEPGLILSNIEIRLMLRQYLSLPLERTLGLPNSHLRCQCETSSSAGKFYCSGNHLFNCHPSEMINRRHEQVVDVVAEAFRSVHIVPERERPVATVPEIGSDGRRKPAKRYDLVAEPCDGGTKVWCMDIKVASHTFINNLHHARSRPLYNAMQSHAKKHSKYRKHIDNDCEVMCPLIVETSGAIHYSFNRLFTHMGTRANGKPPVQASWSAPTFSAYWLQRTSVVVWRETARTLLFIARKTVISKGYPWKTPILTTQMIVQPQLLEDEEGQDLTPCA